MTWVKRYRDGFRQKIKETWRELWRHVRVWSLFHTVIVMIIICLAALAVAWCLWGLWAKITTPNTRSTVSLATVGGLGGLVALVVAYRKQAMSERNEVDGKLADAVHLLGDQMPSTRIAGVYALTNVGDRYPEKRQQIIDILCGYLRTKREADRPTESTIITILKSKLDKNSWPRNQDLDLDMHGATIDERLDFRGMRIHDLIFDDATFNDDATFGDKATFDSASFDSASFVGAVFNGSATFDNATFGSFAVFDSASFNSASFDDTTFKGSASFVGAVFKDSASFNSAVFNSASFNDTTSDDSAVFDSAVFKGSASFNHVEFKGLATFDNTVFGTDASFDDASFDVASFDGNPLDRATFKDEAVGEHVRDRAIFSDALALFKHAVDGGE